MDSLSESLIDKWSQGLTQPTISCSLLDPTDACQSLLSTVDLHRAVCLYHICLGIQSRIAENGSGSW
jgi:hypothetical protein